MKSCSAILVYMRTIVISMIWRETSWRPTSSSSALHFSLDKKKVAATLRDAVPLFSSPYPTPPLIPSLEQYPSNSPFYYSYNKMAMRAEDREPCPWRIVEDAGGAFVFGMVGGLVWHSVGGARNAPRGEVMQQMAYRVKTRVPIVAGSFAVWGLCFSCFDCTFTALRKKEDPWNAILSGAATGNRSFL